MKEMKENLVQGRELSIPTFQSHHLHRENRYNSRSPNMVEGGRGQPGKQVEEILKWIKRRTTTSVHITQVDGDATYSLGAVQGCYVDSREAQDSRLGARCGSIMVMCMQHPREVVRCLIKVRVA